ncbi:MAG: TlpA family protein disulfide reductase [Acidobacteria bacterium]|nr:TlpA family protein disulfide reductase [Acidobacteriota bacterium]
MAKAGIQAPDFTLPDIAGAARPLREWLEQGPVLIAFFKISCPTCQYTFPFLQRLAGSSVPVLGISQDVRKKTEGFNREYGIRFPVLLDSEDANYPVSNAYGITHVPSLFLVEPDGRIGLTSVGFVRKDLEEIAQRFGVREVFHRDEKIEAFRAG